MVYRSAAETAVADIERRIAAQARESAQRAERLARLRGQAEAAAGQAAAAQGEAGRLSEALDQASARAQTAQEEFEQLQELVSGREEGLSDLAAAARARGFARLKEARASVARLRKAVQTASGDLAGLRARSDALAEAVTRGADASAVLLAQPEPVRRGAGAAGGARLLTVADGAQGRRSRRPWARPRVP